MWETDWVWHFIFYFWQIRGEHEHTKHSFYNFKAWTLKSPANSIMTYRIWEKFCHHHLTYTSPGSPEYWPTCRNIQKVRQVRKFAPCLHEHCTVWCELAILSMTRIQWRKIKLTLFMKTFRTPSLLNTFCLWEMYVHIVKPKA